MPRQSENPMPATAASRPKANGIAPSTRTPWLSAFQQLPLRAQLDIIHLAIFDWPLDAVSPTAELLASGSLKEATAKLIRSDRVRGYVGESALQFERLDRRSQLDIVHQALFGWPMDELTDTYPLLEAPSLREAVRRLLKSERVQVHVLAGSESFRRSALREQLDDVHTAIFGWPMDPLSPVEELLNSASLQEAVHKLLGTERVRFTTRDAAPLWPADKWVCTDFFDLRIWVNLNDSYVARGVLEGNWENEEVGFVLDQLAPGDAMVDVGANVGVYALQAARAVGPEGRVYAFEPQADTFAMLSRSVRENGFEDRVVLHNLALGDRDGQATVWRHHSNNPGASFITSEPLQGAGNATRLMRLDSLEFDRPVKLLKMDIEGYEPLLVAGAADFLRRHRPVIITEWYPRAMSQVGGSSPAQYFERLTELGYDVRLMNGRDLGDPLTKDHPAFADDAADPINIACMPRDAVAEPKVRRAA